MRFGLMSLRGVLMHSAKKNGRVEKISSGRYISAISTVKKYIRLTF